MKSIAEQLSEVLNNIEILNAHIEAQTPDHPDQQIYCDLLRDYRQKLAILQQGVGS
jgi:hypothetical protein